MNRIKLSKEQIYLSLVCSLSAMVVLPIAVFGIPESVDLPQHFKFARLFHEALAAGNFFPGWAGAENFGYGDVGIRFYPPLEYYLLAFTRLAVGNWYDATWLTFVFWTAIGSLGVYYWGRCWMSPKDSTVAACVYLFVPFHLHHLYVSFNNYSEFAAASVLGFCFAFLTRIFYRRETADIFGLAIAFALLVLLHLPSTIIGTASLFVYALFLIRKENLLQAAMRCAAAGALALAASAFYWVVLLGEMKWLNHTTERFASGYFDFDRAFFPFIYHAVGYPGTILIVDATVIFTVAFYAAAVVIWFFYKRRTPSEFDEPETEVFRRVLPLGVLAFLMVTSISRPLWQSLAVLQKVQFPTRWLNIVTLCVPLVAAAAIHFLRRGNFFERRTWIYACLTFAFLISIFNVVYILHPTSFAPNTREKFEQRVATLPEYESFDCWWTIWSRREAFDVKEKVLAANRTVEIGEWQSEKREFTVAAGEPAKARIATFYYPHWQATVNNVPVEIEKDENGVMLVPLSEEKSKIKLVFQEPLTNRIASIISIAAWLILFLAFLFFKYKKSASLESSESYFVREETTC